MYQLCTTGVKAQRPFGVSPFSLPPGGDHADRDVRHVRSGRTGPEQFVDLGKQGVGVVVVEVGAGGKPKRPGADTGVSVGESPGGVRDTVDPARGPAEDRHPLHPGEVLSDTFPISDTKARPQLRASPRRNPGRVRTIAARSLLAASAAASRAVRLDARTASVTPPKAGFPGLRVSGTFPAAPDSR